MLEQLAKFNVVKVGFRGCGNMVVVFVQDAGLLPAFVQLRNGFLVVRTNLTA